ncbi:DUF2017 domain-containing protein [Solwaraspora sp. WMMA2080]|uniref:DUF2017 domain-containing protein n=1 Tax=unclassified Solwaraspora TaxID=2627926 RepID=UPI00248C65BC|nr:MULTISPECIES: DUF2017 domain-containing protein [unclassified Solwaraspora]WBB98192.1 DUF2017 domain-containing protein [Solwaraspora sp. WMMA2059]WBC23254.1 DUF2017 domain-containing protein [Solwaraspora sp. WMMA2080]
MSMFRRRNGRIVAVFSPDEVRVLRKVAGEVVGLLTDGFERDDPVVDRLFPDTYRDDPASSAELRRYTESDLKTAKIDQAGAVLAALPADADDTGAEVRLDGEAAEAWLRAINDARLAMGVRLQVRADTDLGAELAAAERDDPSSSRLFQLSVYAYLGYLQESLLGALLD